MRFWFKTPKGLTLAFRKGVDPEDLAEQGNHHRSLHQFGWNAPPHIVEFSSEAVHAQKGCGRNHQPEHRSKGHRHHVRRLQYAPGCLEPPEAESEQTHACDEQRPCGISCHLVAELLLQDGRQVGCDSEKHTEWNRVGLKKFIQLFHGESPMKLIKNNLAIFRISQI